jgi:hypothetical protein
MEKKIRQCKHNFTVSRMRKKETFKLRPGNYEKFIINLKLNEEETIFMMPRTMYNVITSI